MNQSLITRLVLVFIACAALAQTGYAQKSYNRGIGLRLGPYAAVSYKQFVSETGAFELQIGSRGYSRRYSYTSFGAAYLHHKEMDNLLAKWNLKPVDNFNYYLGGGISGYAWGARDPFYSSLDDHLSWGLELYAGLEYTFKEWLPLAVSVDWSPRYFFGNNYGYYSRLGWGYSTLTLRYVIIK